MKKWLTPCLLLVLLLSLSACQAARAPGLAWDAGEMVELAVYQLTGDGILERKTTQDKAAIQQVAAALKKMRVKREMRTGDAQFEGGTHFTFAFSRADGSQEILALLGDIYLYVEAGPFVLAQPPRPGAGELWDELPGDPQPVDAAPTPGSYPAANS